MAKSKLPKEVKLRMYSIVENAVIRGISMGVKVATEKAHAGLPGVLMEEEILNKVMDELDEIFELGELPE